VTSSTLTDTSSTTTLYTFELGATVSAGATSFEVTPEAELRIGVGDYLIFSPGTLKSERVTVTGFGSVLFSPALVNTHEAGSIISVEVAPPTTTTSSPKITKTSEISDEVVYVIIGGFALAVLVSSLVLILMRWQSDSNLSRTRVVVLDFRL
jgi:hypothetical protein